MSYNTAATISKLISILIVFTIFYLVLYFGGLGIGLPMILAVIAANVVEVKIIVSNQERKQ